MSGPSTKDRLSTIVQGFDGFETEMKIGTRQRREKDEFRIAELKNEMKRLDNELLSEIRRRTEMNKSTQMWFEQNLTVLNETFHKTLTDRHTETSNRLNGLNNRISELEARFVREKADILALIDQRGRELAEMLNKFKAEFDHDRTLRLAREEQLMKQLTDHEHEVSEKMERQIESREARYAAVRTLLEDNIKLHDKAEEKFQAFFEREVNRLRNDVRKESEVREREDDEIIEALNRYTLKLQNSLKIINSTDM